MTPERRKEIEQLLATATPGPWSWNEQAYNESPLSNGKKRRRKWDLYVYLLQGRPQYRRYNDRIDASDNTIMSLEWGWIKGGTLFNATPKPSDRELIAAAPTIIRELLNEIDRLSGKDVPSIETDPYSFTEADRLLKDWTSD